MRIAQFGDEYILDILCLLERTQLARSVCLVNRQFYRVAAPFMYDYGAHRISVVKIDLEEMQFQTSSSACHFVVNIYGGNVSSVLDIFGNDQRRNNLADFSAENGQTKEVLEISPLDDLFPNILCVRRFPSEQRELYELMMGIKYDEFMACWGYDDIDRIVFV